MSILLTDEEIYEVEHEWLFEWGEIPHLYKVDFCKAQLKKVVDLIRNKTAYTAIVSETGNEIPFFNPIDWEEIWQALLKETE